MNTTAKEQLARETAEHIVTNLMPQESTDGVTIVGQEGMPTTVEEVAATLLGGHLWLSWADDRTQAAMGQMHAETS